MYKPKIENLNDFRSFIEKARAIQEITVNSAEDDTEKTYSLGWLHALDSLLDVINSK